MHTHHWGHWLLLPTRCVTGHVTFSRVTFSLHFYTSLSMPIAVVTKLFWVVLHKEPNTHPGHWDYEILGVHSTLPRHQGWYPLIRLSTLQVKVFVDKIQQSCTFNWLSNKFNLTEVQASNDIFQDYILRNALCICWVDLESPKILAFRLEGWFTAVSLHNYH